MFCREGQGALAAGADVADLDLREVNDLSHLLSVLLILFLGFVQK